MSSPSPISQKNSENNNIPSKIFDLKLSNKNFLNKYMNVRRANKNELYRKIKKIKSSETFDNICPKKINWIKDINEYEKEKKKLKWGKNPPVKYFSHLYMNSEDRTFDPITQKYLDKEKEEKLKNIEKTDLINNISKCYDKQLSTCQTFNIINLQDKFKGLEKDSKYPKSPRTQRIKCYSLIPKTNYNIISNLNYNIHHYDKPENRPNINDSFNKERKNRKTIVIKGSLKDFNILTNEYLNNSEERKRIDKDFYNLKAAKKYYQFRKINPITGVYNDEKKEKDYQDKKDLIIKKILNRKRENIFNPLNFKIYNEEQFKRNELLNLNKRSRYKVRNQFDNYYKYQNNLIEEKYMTKLKHTLSYNRIKQNEARTYDIINHKQLLNLNINDIDNKDKSPWHLIQEDVNEHETISKNKNSIVRDKSDILRKYIYNKLKRERIIKNLPGFENETIFKMNKNEKINLGNLEKSEIIKTNSFNSDKKAWFNL